MEKEKTATAETVTAINPNAKVQKNSDIANDLSVNQLQTSKISMISNRITNCENQLSEKAITDSKNNDVWNLFGSLGYTDKKQYERLLKFLDKGPFNDLDPSITRPNFRFNICGVDCVPSGEVIGVGGKPGAGKSTSLAIFIGVMLGKTTFAGIRCITPCKKVLWIDTEKGDFSCKQKMAVFRRIANMVDNTPLENHGITFRQMRGERLIDRIAFIDYLFAQGNYDCVVIDGIFDLTDDANDHCAPVIELLQRLVKNGTSVFAMLHTNKNDDNFRYAMGTELTRIATTLFKVDFNKTSGIHSITHDKSNDTALAPQVTFKFSEDGNVYVPDVSAVDKKAEAESSKDKKLRKAFINIFKNKKDGIGYRDLARQLTKEYKYKADKDSGFSKSAIDRINDAKGKGIISQHDDKKYYFKE